MNAQKLFLLFVLKYVIHLIRISVGTCMTTDLCLGTVHWIVLFTF